VGGTRAGALVVRVHAPPAEGQANLAVRRALAAAFEVAPGAVDLVAGERSRRKRARIGGDPRALSALLERIAREPV
jgi:uncharacterized protein (TIGR00251 family)